MVRPIVLERLPVHAGDKFQFFCFAQHGGISKDVLFRRHRNIVCQHSLCNIAEVQNYEKKIIT